MVSSNTSSCGGPLNCNITVDVQNQLWQRERSFSSATSSVPSRGSGWQSTIEAAKNSQVKLSPSRVDPLPFSRSNSALKIPNREPWTYKPLTLCNCYQHSKQTFIASDPSMSCLRSHATAVVNFCLFLVSKSLWEGSRCVVKVLGSWAKYQTLLRLVIGTMGFSLGPRWNIYILRFICFLEC